MNTIPDIELIFVHHRSQMNWRSNGINKTNSNFIVSLLLTFQSEVSPAPSREQNVYIVANNLLYCFDEFFCCQSSKLGFEIKILSGLGL